MITTTAYADKKVIVLGLGRSGLSAARSLRVGGAHVYVWDDNADTRKAVAREFEARNPQTVKWRDYDALLIAPGIPLTHPEPHVAVLEALRAGRSVIGDLEIFARSGNAARSIGITGTNGKSTTTSLVGHILTHTGRPNAVGGNIGYPVLDLPPLGPDGVYAVELSSFQIDLAPSLAVDVGVLLNVSVDHLDRHGSMNHYASVKAKLLHQQSPTAISVVSLDDPYTASIAKDLFMAGRRIIGISAKQTIDDGVYIQNGKLIDSIHGVPHEVLDLAQVVRLKGQHNWQNVAAAYAAVRALGLGTMEAAEAIISFPGLAHRQEYVGICQNVAFVNDSKATNVEATAKALQAHENIFWIVGGRPKPGGLTGLEDKLDAVSAAYTIGESTDSCADFLEGRVPEVETCGIMNLAILRAFEAAARVATPEAPATILLSPACASFDQFASFEERGDTFRSLAHIMFGKARSNDPNGDCGNGSGVGQS